MTQMLLFPNPRPLVERLGREFFRQAPECPGVYLMRDAADTVLYVGKAKNLRKRLASYRVANPDRLPRRHLRLLNSVARIELQTCADETLALAREAELLRSLHPRFNRAGVWPGPSRFLGWRVTTEGMDLAVLTKLGAEWQGYGPLGFVANHLRAALVRLLWCAIHPERALAGLPTGWFSGHHSEIVTIPYYKTAAQIFHESSAYLGNLCAGQTDEFARWIQERTARHTQLFEIAAREEDLETVTKFAARIKPDLHPSQVKIEST